MQGLCLPEAEFPRKRKAWGYICRNVVCWAEAPTGTEDCPQPPWMCCKCSPRAGSPPILTMDKTIADSIPSQYIPAAHSGPLTGILLSRLFVHLHLASVWFAAASPRHHGSCGCISTRTSFTELIYLKWGICILLWAEDLCQQHKQETFFRSAGQAPSAGNYKSWFQAEFISILVKSLQSSRAFLFRLTCLLLTIR